MSYRSGTGKKFNIAKLLTKKRKRQQDTSNGSSSYQPLKKRSRSQNEHQLALRVCELAKEGANEVEFQNVLCETLHGFGMSTQIELMPHQLRGIQFALRHAQSDLRRGCVIADEPGMGKTVQALCVALILSRCENTAECPVLIVCPKGVVTTWIHECERYFSRCLMYRAYEKIASDSPPPSVFAAMDMLIITHSALAKLWSESLRPIQTLREADQSYAPQGIRFDHEGHPIVTEKAERGAFHKFFTTKFSMIIADELHIMRNMDSCLFGAMYCLQTHSAPQISVRLGLTGTPIINRQEDKNALCEFCGFPALEWSSHVQRTFKHETSITARSSNEAIYLKGFAGVPDAILHIVNVKPTTALLQVMTALRKTKNAGGAVQLLRQAAESLENPTDALRAACGSDVLMKARCEEHPKLTALREIVNEARKAHEKVLVFCYYCGTAEGFAEKLSALKLTGDGSDDREDVLMRFKSKPPRQIANRCVRSPKNDVLVCTHCINTGINLTEASVVIFVSPWWQPNEELQCASRTHRPGQQRSVKVYKLILQDSIEKHVIDVSEHKSELLK